ncbi:unnamed protein product, partial [Rotaria magnacalcarata]
MSPCPRHYKNTCLQTSVNSKNYLLLSYNFILKCISNLDALKEQRLDDFNIEDSSEVVNGGNHRSTTELSS